MKEPAASTMRTTTSTQTTEPSTSIDKIHFKITHEGHNRRFVISCNEGDLLSQLKAQVFRITQTENVEIFWKGEESQIVIASLRDIEMIVDWAKRQSSHDTFPCIQLEVSLAEDPLEEIKDLNISDLMKEEEQAKENQDNVIALEELKKLQNFIKDMCNSPDISTMDEIRREECYFNNGHLTAPHRLNILKRYTEEIPNFLEIETLLHIKGIDHTTELRHLYASDFLTTNLGVSINKMRSHDAIFTFNEAQDDETIAKIGRTLIARIHSYVADDLTDESIHKKIDSLRAKCSEREDAEELASFKELTNALHNFFHAPPTPISDSDSDMNTAKSQRVNTFRLSKRWPPGDAIQPAKNNTNRCRKINIRDKTPLTPSQQAILDQLLVFDMSHFDRFVEICRVSNNLDDAMDLMNLDSEQNEILKSLWNMDIRIPMIVEFDILTDLISIQDDKMRLQYYSHQLSQLEKKMKDKGEDILLAARSIKEAFKYTAGNLMRIHRRHCLLASEFGRDLFAEIHPLRDVAKRLRRGLFFENPAPASGDRNYYPYANPNLYGPKEPKVNENTLLIELLNSNIFDDYGKMVAVSRVASNLEEAIDKLLV